MKTTLIKMLEFGSEHIDNFPELKRGLAKFNPDDFLSVLGGVYFKRRACAKTVPSMNDLYKFIESNISKELINSIPQNSTERELIDLLKLVTTKHKHILEYQNHTSIDMYGNTTLTIGDVGVKPMDLVIELKTKIPESKHEFGFKIDKYYNKLEISSRQTSPNKTALEQIFIQTNMLELLFIASLNISENIDSINKLKEQVFTNQFLSYSIPAFEHLYENINTDPSPPGFDQITDSEFGRNIDILELYAILTNRKLENSYKRTVSNLGIDFKSAIAGLDAPDITEVHDLPEITYEN